MLRSTSYEVGYGKPPKASQFKKGVSGNPRGREKRTSDLLSALLRILRQSITIEEGRTKRKVSKLQAIVIRLVNRAVGGDLQAIKVLSRYQMRNGSPALKRKAPTVKYVCEPWVDEAAQE